MLCFFFFLTFLLLTFRVSWATNMWVVETHTMFHRGWFEVLAVMVTWGLEGHYGLALLASSSVSGDRDPELPSCHESSRGWQRCKGEDWISGLYTNWEHPFWGYKKVGNKLQFIIVIVTDISYWVFLIWQFVFERGKLASLVPTVTSPWNHCLVRWWVFLLLGTGFQGSIASFGAISTNACRRQQLTRWDSSCCDWCFLLLPIAVVWGVRACMK